MGYKVTPKDTTIVLTGTFAAPAAHIDPAINTRSNDRLFRRDKKLIHRDVDGFIDAAIVADLVQSYPAPSSLITVFNKLSAAEFLAVAFVREWISEYSYGVGLFDGVERYRRLEERIKMAAVRSATMFEFYSQLNNDMQVPAVAHPTRFAKLLGVPAALGWLILKAFIDQTASVLVLARTWGEYSKDDAVFASPRPVADTTASSVVLDTPAISANSIRHEMLREPGMWHLLNSLDLTLDDLPRGVQVLLYNGGDLKTSEPSDAFKLAQTIRERYPLLGLLGGSCDGFILGTSNVSVNAWLMTREYNAELARFGLVSDVSAFELLDRHTLTRHAAGRVDSSPMPYGFEVLIAGTSVLIEIRMRPYIRDLEMGALWASINTYFEGDGTLFGQGAKGYGLVNFDVLEMPSSVYEMQGAYEQYLVDNADVLRDGLMSGTLASGKVVLT